MKRLLCILAIGLTLGMGHADAGSSVSGGGARGGFSGGSVSSGSRGGFSSSPSVSAPSNRGSFSSAPAATAPRTTTTTTTTTRSSSYHYSSPYVSSYGMYGGFGMAYGYNNGLLTGLIIGGMMHPHHTVVYTGPGVHANNALLYPDGRVVNQSGVLIGTYQNGQFTSIENGGVVAQQVPHDAGQQQAQQQQPVPIVIKDNSMDVGDWILIFLMCTMIMVMFAMLILRR